MSTPPTTPTVAYAWLHKPTGAAGLSAVWPLPDGGPTAGQGTRLLEPDTPLPSSERGPSRWSARTTAQVEAVLFQRGWRVMTRGEARRVLGDRSDLGDRIPASRHGRGHVLASDLAEDTRWTTECEHTTCAFVVRLADVPTPTRGSGAIVCCGGHRARCLFGAQHTWATWYENAHLMRTSHTYSCSGCAGICTSEEADAFDTLEPPSAGSEEANDHGTGWAKLTAEATSLAKEIDELTRVWDDTEEVDTNLGTDVEQAGRRLVCLLDHLANQRSAGDPTRFEQLQQCSAELDAVVTYYEDLEEHDTNASLDIVERLGPGIALARQVLHDQDPQPDRQSFTASQLSVGSTRPSSP